MLNNPIVRSFLLYVLLPWSIFGICAILAMIGYSINEKGNALTDFATICATMSLFGGLAGAWQFLKIIRSAKKSDLPPLPSVKFKLPKLSYKFLYIPIILLIILALLNPSYTRFKEFAADLTTTQQKPLFKKVSNYLIYSIYEKQIVTVIDVGEYQYSKSDRYIGFCLNFYKVKK